MIYITSDQHLNHRHSIDLWRTNFHTQTSMNEYIVTHWNAVVGEDDTVYCLGDLALGTEYYAEEQIRRLNGHIKLILGNHDFNKVPMYIEKGLVEVVGYSTVLKNGDYIYFLTHYPHTVPAEDPNVYYLTGHSHDHEPFFKPETHNFNVSVENTDYMPLPIDYFAKHIKEGRNNPNVIFEYTEVAPTVQKNPAEARSGETGGETHAD